MKTLCTLGILILSIHISSAQLFEIAENRDFHNEFNCVVSPNDSTIYISGNYNLLNSYFSGAFLKAIDKNGNLLWEYLTPLDVEVRFFTNLIILPNNNILVLGQEQWCCDCTAPFFQIHIFSPYGELLQSNSFEEIEMYFNTPKADYNGNILAIITTEYVSSTEYLLHALNSSAEQLWTYNLGIVEPSHLSSIGSDFVVFSESEILRIDSNGILTGNIPYDSPPQNVLKVDDESILFIVDDEVFELTSDLSINPVEFESSTTDIEDWLKSDEFIYVIAEGEIRKLNLNYELLQTTIFEPLPYHQLKSAWCNEEYCVFAGEKALSFEGYPYDIHHRSAVAYSVMLDNSQLEHYPDVAVRSLTLNTFNVNHPETGVFSFSGNATGYVVNTGDVIVESVDLYHFIGPSPFFCGLIADHIALNELSLLPGDSVEFNMDVQQTYGWYPTNQGVANFCVFSASPNNLSDRDETNDVGCVSQNFGVGIFENSEFLPLILYPNPATNQLFVQTEKMTNPNNYRIFDLSGREVQSGSVVNSSIIEINIRNLVNGSYILHISDQDKHFRGRFIVAN